MKLPIAILAITYADGHTQTASMYSEENLTARLDNVIKVGLATTFTVYRPTHQQSRHTNWDSIKLSQPSIG